MPLRTPQTKKLKSEVIVMLISRVAEEGERWGEGGTGDGGAREHHEHERSGEYQTANDLFELMAKNYSFEHNEADTLSTRDLVLLYKNIDLGTQLMSNANEFKRKTPNQYVETVIYNEDVDSESSDISEIYSNEDLHNMFLINKERIDLLNNRPSLDSPVCHKYGDLQIQSSNLMVPYDKHFLFKDAIKEQLQSLSLMSNTIDAEDKVLPASLLDYICCKRLEDNYTFYMDNIIRYVKHTIEQLKRISNGDYLTDRAKEKWKEVDFAQSVCDDGLENTKVLARSTSIPLHVERKVTGNKTTWDDIVHSEVDVRSLSKILEKRIVLEMPKLICGSYRLFSKRCADNLIISCEREKIPIVHENKESRVDVYFQLKRSGSGHVISNISSIMILQTAPINTETTGSDALPLPMKEENNHEDNEHLSEHKIRVTEVEIDNEDSIATSYNRDSNESNVENEQKPEEDDSVETNYPYSAENSFLNVRDALQFTSCSLEANTHNVTPEICLSPDDLGLTMQMLDIQKSLPEENAEDGTLFTVSKRKSSAGIRIKSPYENRSYLLDEKKRKKLLEIREKREKKKLSMVESCKMTKHKYGRSNVLPQASSSVTKLSITNKSFYNSIYGTSPIIDGRQIKSRGRKPKKEVVLDIPCERFEDCSVITPDTDCRKYVNRSYYLDDAVTEMMCMKMNEDKIKRKYGDAFSGSTSAVSNDFSTNLNILSQLIMPSVTDFNITEISSEPVENSVEEGSHNNCIRNDQNLQIYPIESKVIKNMVRKCSPKSNNRIDKDDSKKPISTVEFKQSIDKIYDLIKKNDKSNEIDISITKSKFTSTNIEKINVVGNRESSILQASDSGTSVKHHLTSSSPSNFSFGKTKKQDAQKVKSSNCKKSDTPIAVVPKVIISAKQQNMLKNDIEKLRKDHRRFNDKPSIKIAENPLKAISQLLHDIDYVQKTRQKTEPKIIRKSETVSAESARANLQEKRHSRLEQLLIENEHVAEKYPRTTTPREKRPKSISESSRITHQVNIEEKRGDKISKKKISDIIDEAKEARGEAVRGPSKLNSRISTLAQPKKSYVQAHSEEYLTKYGKNVLTDRLQRLAGVPLQEKNVNPNYPRVKPKRSGPEASSTVSVRQPQSPASPLERTRMRGSTNISPEAKSNRSPATFEPSHKQNINETHEPVKKMVAVESYVKSHFGRSSLPPELRDLHAVQKSRVPLIPLGMELESMASSPTVEESTALGIKLHHIINTMLNSEVQNIPEDIESKGKITTDVASKDGESNRETKDIATAFVDDNTVLTTIDSVSESILLEPPANSKHTEIVEKTDMNIQSFNSAMELEKLEKALYRQMSTGTFQKRLRIKNLTLTPKHSIQRLLVMQAGDSLVVKSTLSKNLKITTSKSADISQLKAVPAMCDSPADRTFSKIPMQVTTVGYSFPVTFQSIQCNSYSRMKTSNPTKSDTSEKKENDLSAKENVKSDKVSQCFKGRQSDTQFDLEWQANIIDRKTEVTPANDTGMTCSQPEEYVKTIAFNRADDNSFSLNKMETNLNISGDKEIKKVTSAIRGEDNICIETKCTKVEYTTSLDMLVGLLNEIQKITTCQTQITNNFSAASDHDGKYENRPIIELDNILKEVKTKTDSAQDVVSMTSLDKLRHLESNPSIYSYCLSNEDDQTRKKDTAVSNITAVYTNRFSIYNLPVCADKEVSADFPELEYVHTFTDVPSQFLPITITHSTNMSTSFFGVISKPSTQSMFSFTEYQGVSPDVQFKCNKKIIELPHEPIDADPSRHMVNATQNKQFPHNNEKTQRVEHIAPEWVPTVEKHSVSRAVSQKTKRLRNEKQDIRRSSPYIDPVMKLKRDILLMAYSVLVFAVFSALSFPELMYRT